MSFILTGIDRLAARTRSVVDLILLWLASVVIQPIISPETLLANDDLVPWAACTVASAAYIRGRRLGGGGHPQLRPRVTGLDTNLRRLTAAMVPLLVWCWFRSGQALGRGELADIVAGLQDHSTEAIAGLGWSLFGTAGLLAVVAFSAWSRDYQRTAWRPAATRTGRVLGFGGAAFWLAAVLSGTVHGAADLANPSTTWAILRWMPESVVLGMAFLAVGLVFGRPTARAQRLVAGRVDGRPVRLVEREFLFASLGPLFTLWLTMQMVEQLTGRLVGFESAYVVSLLAVSWAAVVWKRPLPRAVDVLLHEVVPAGGRDEVPDGVALSFDRPPEGALRIRPLRVRGTRSTHIWRVPVAQPRIDDLDDPIRPLWRDKRAPPSHHLIGEASFEPDEYGGPQWSELTLRLGVGRDVTVLQENDIQTRRMVIIRPFPPAADRRRQTREVMRTYRWEESYRAGALQVVDGATRTLSLRDGDLIVVSSEGLARAYQVEFGRAVDTFRGRVSLRLPQLQDYVAP